MECSVNHQRVEVWLTQLVVYFYETTYSVGDDLTGYCYSVPNRARKKLYRAGPKSLQEIIPQ